MGQRHQIFVKINNPVKSDRNQMSKEDNAKASKIFGRGKYTVIALHHQWLYGNSVACNIANILRITDIENMAYNSPFNSKAVWISNLDDYIKEVMMMFQVQTNLLHPRGIGIENMHFLNTDCLDDDGKYCVNWDMRKNFCSGDNNDGITIIDTIERKYCTMNIYEYDSDCDSGIYSLPTMKPQSALEYVNAYYPKQKSENETYIFDLGLNDVEILNTKELSKISPKDFKENLVD